LLCKCADNFFTDDFFLLKVLWRGGEGFSICKVEGNEKIGFCSGPFDGHVARLEPNRIIGTADPELSKTCENRPLAKVGKLPIIFAFWDFGLR
jgi:hypothetical protein